MGVMDDEQTTEIHVKGITVKSWGRLKNLSNDLRAAGHPDWQLSALLQRAIDLFLAQGEE